MGLMFSKRKDDNWTVSSRNILITGASSGIGAELARKFAAEGANLALLARSESNLEKVAKECRELSDGSSNITIHCCDLTNNKEIESALSDAIEKSINNQFDVVILNAGRSQGCYFSEINDVDQIDYMMKLNIGGVIIPIQKLLPSVVKCHKSRIVVISSVAGLIPVPYRTIYCATKSAINAFCGSLRMELNDTYAYDMAPKVCVVNFPEVKNTALNSDRMNFGAKLLPAQFDPDAAQELSYSCEQCIEQAIKPGIRSWGQPLKVSLLLPLLTILPNILEVLIMKHIKKTTSRPNLPNTPSDKSTEKVQ